MSANPFRLVLHNIRQRFGLDVAGASIDALLLERFAAAGDEAAFAALVERHGAMVWGVCRRVAGNPHAAEDAFQATWIVLSRKARTVRDGGSLPGWLHRVAHRLALAARARPTDPLVDAPVAAPGPEEEAALNELCRVVDEEVSRLPEKYRLPVVLCFLEGRTHAEAAAELGWPIGTVAGRVARAKDLLHARLTRRGLAPSALPLALAAAGTFPPVAGKAAGAGAVSLAAALLAGEVRRRWLVGMAGLLLSCAGVAVGVAVYRAPSPSGPSSGMDRTVRVGAAHAGPEQVILKGHTGQVFCVAYSPDGKQALTGSSDGTARLWDPETGQQKVILRGHTEAVWCVAFSPDGKRVLTGSLDCTARIWDAETGQEIVSIKPLPNVSQNEAFARRKGLILSVAYSPDGKRVLTVSAGEALAHLWDAQTGQQVAALRVWAVLGTPEGNVRYPDNSVPREWTSVAFSPDGKQVLTGCLDGTARLWDARTGQEKAILRGHTGSVKSMVFSPDGKRILTGGGEMARLWDAETGREMGVLQGHPGHVLSVAFSPDGKRIATGSKDSTARIFDVQTGKLAATLRGHTDSVDSVAFSPDGQRLLTASFDNTVRVWDIQSGQEMLALKGTGVVEDTEARLPVAYSPDGRYVLTGRNKDNAARVWDVQKGLK